MSTLAKQFGCSPPITCPGSDLPLLNLSSESPDQPIFIGLNWGPVPPPPALNIFTNLGCLGECDSTISQQDADLCAARQSVFCFPPPVPGNPTVTVCNQSQTATVNCPDGLPFSYTVPAGLFCGKSQTLVNEQASAYAMKQANTLKVCLGNVQRCCCINQAYLSVIPITGATGTVSWSIVSGSLPSGLQLTQSGSITGIPILAGTSSFTVQALTPAGTFMRKPFVIVVLQITTLTIPQFSVGTPYSFQLMAIGGSGNYAWKVISGSLPDGLSLKLSGLISGTPTGVNSGSGTILFGVVDQNCEALDQSFFPPAVKLSGTATTTSGVLLGFSEYQGFASNPPKKYRRLTWQGSSEQTLFFGTTQIAGARYDYTGATEIDNSGNVLSTYSKNLSEMCTAADSLCSGVGFNSNTLLAPGVAAYNIKGWLGFPQSILTSLQFPTQFQQSLGFPGIPPGFDAATISAMATTNPLWCTPPGVPYTGQGDQAVKTGEGAKYDEGFPSGVNFGAGLQFSNFHQTFAVTSATAAGDTSIGTQAIPVLFIPITCGTLIPEGFVLESAKTSANLNWTHNYSATLDEEYTEATALSLGRSRSGPGVTAAYFRNGFNVTWTQVNWILSFSNLIPGVNYLATYQLWNTTIGTKQTVTVPFTATGATFSMSGTIPVPASGQAVTIRNATVTFA